MQKSVGTGAESHCLAQAVPQQHCAKEKHKYLVNKQCNGLRKGTRGKWMWIALAISLLQIPEQPNHNIIDINKM